MSLDGFRLLIWVSILSVCFGSNVPILKSSEVLKFINENDNCVIGYLTQPKCNFTDVYAKEMEIAHDKLAEYGIKLAITNESNVNNDRYGPYSILYRKGHSDIKIDWIHDGEDIAQWVNAKVNNYSVFKVESEESYNYFLTNFKTVFAAYLTTDSQVENYRRLADEFQAVFLYTIDKNVADNVFKINPDYISAVHNWADKRREDYHLSYSDYDKKWISKQISHTASEITHRNAYIPFSVKQLHIAFLFIRKSDSDFKSTVDSFEVASQKTNDIAIFFVDLDKSENAPLLEYFGMSSDLNTAIVLLPDHRSLDYNLYAHVCSYTGGKPLRSLWSRYSGTAMIENYSSEVGRL